MEPTEHLVIRNPELNEKNLDVIKVWNLRKCEVLTQSKIGGVPAGFAADKHGQPRNVHAGDLVWFAQSDYGVIGTLRIKTVYPITKVKSHSDIDELKRQHPALAATYWEHLREQLPKLNGRVMYFAGVATAFVQQFSLAEQFRLNKLGQRSWVVLNAENKKELFKNQGQSAEAASLEYEAGGDYGKITPRVRFLIARIWKDECFGDQEPGEAIHLDHVVPKALGGPGILVENIVRLPASINLAKKHFVVKDFVDVARIWGLLTDEEYSGWGEMFDENAILTRQQRNLTERITMAIRGKPPHEQRKFYFQILEKLVGKRVRELFKAAGVPLPPDV